MRMVAQSEDYDVVGVLHEVHQLGRVRLAEVQVHDPVGGEKGIAIETRTLTVVAGGQGSAVHDAGEKVIEGLLDRGIVQQFARIDRS